jgi:putative transposase
VYRRTIKRDQDEEDLLLCRLIDEEYTRRPFLRQSAHGGVSAQAWAYRQRQAGAAAHAHDGLGGNGAGAEHEGQACAAQGISVSAARRGRGEAKCGVEYGRDLHPPSAWLCLRGSGDRLVLAARAVMADLEQHGCVVPRGLLEDALRVHGKPEVFNSDQRAQFTSNAFTGVLKREGIAISMDGRGRALDNIFVERLWRSVMYEDVYLQGYGTMGELTLGLARYFAFYNGERPYQSLGNRTPHEAYASGQGGGAKIIDKYGGAREESLAPLRRRKGFLSRRIRAALFCCK